jgi:hypothetical protein
MWQVVADTSKVQKTQQELEQEFVDRAITRLSRVCESTNINAWGPQGEAEAAAGGGGGKGGRRGKKGKR